MRRAALVCTLIVGSIASASAQDVVSRCVSCHVANPRTVPMATHLAEWRASAHGRRGIGCEHCHGGDPLEEQPVYAHRGVLGAAHPNSMVHAENLVRTCAPCHLRNAQAFRTSLHHTLVQAGERRAPTCITCHGAMNTRVPSPATLEARCAACHPPASARGAYPALMRTAVESVNALSARETALEDRVAALADHERRVELMVALTFARAALKDAVALVHAFQVQNVDERTAAIRQQLDSIEASVRALP